MIVAIVDKTNPVGVVAVQQFQIAVDEATAVAQYVAAFNPPKNLADWLGYDTGWVTPQLPPSGKNYEWAYDFDNPGLVEIRNPEDRVSTLALTQIISDPKADLSGGTTPNAWEDMGLLSADLDEFYDEGDIASALIKVWGQHKTTKIDANDPLIRFSMGATALSNEIVLPDTGGAFQNFGFSTHGYDLETGRKLYKVQTKLGGANNTVELQAVSLAIMKKNY